MADEYITREDAMRAACKALCHLGALCPDNCCIEVRKVFNAIPAADVVDVVRCKDCVHYDKGENDSESWMYCKVLAKDVYDDFYCELGERREVQGD